MPNGKPELNEEGRRALKGLQENNLHLEENAETGTEGTIARLQEEESST